MEAKRLFRNLRTAKQEPSHSKSASILEFFYRRAGAEEIAVAVNVVDARDGWPEFVFARPRRGESCLFARVGVVPFVRCDLPRGVWRVFEQIILSILFSRGDCFNFRLNRDHRVAKTIELVFRFALGWLY